MSKLDEMLNGMDLTAFLLECKTNFKFFCDNVLSDIFSTGGLQPYMEEWFNLLQENNRVGIYAARGFAKTTILGVAYPLWLAFTKRNKSILVISRSEAQAKRVLSIIKVSIENNPLLIELRPKEARDTWSAKQINTTTNCKIYCRPFTKSILGERTDYVLMDEADSYEYPENYFDYVVPTLNPGGKIALISTPNTGASLMSMINERNLKEHSGYIMETYPAIVDGKSIWPERFPIKCSCKKNCRCDTLENKRKELGEQLFQKNFMCNPMAESGRSIYTAESIHNCSDIHSTFTDKSYGGEVFIGCDFATATGPTADFDCFVVIERVEDRAILKYAEFQRTPDVDAKVQRIIELYERYNPQVVICDESSIGVAILAELRNEGIPTEAQSFQSRARNKLLTNLKTILDHGNLKIPRSPEDLITKRFTDRLELELLSFHEITSKNTGLTSYISVGAHDDTAIALAMAVKHVQIKKPFEDHIGVA